MLQNFNINNSGEISNLFLEIGISDFHEACSHILKLPYGRISDSLNTELVIAEGKGSCSTKHSLLARLALENKQEDIELIMGLFLMSPETHPILEDFFKGKPYNVIPEAHCYLRSKGKRYDFTSTENNMHLIAPKIVREQRIDPHQIGEWKIAIHKDFLQRWLKRNPTLEFDLDQLWNDREMCIQIMEEKPIK